MSQLNSEVQQRFSQGYVPIQICPAHTSDEKDSILVQVKINGRPFQAILDTGAPFSGVISREKNFIDLPENHEQSKSLELRHRSLPGVLYRVTFVIEAAVGNDLRVEGPLFVANQIRADEFRPFIGLGGFLESVCFAIDPYEKRMYFGD